MNNMFVINQFTITGTNTDTYSGCISPERSYKQNVCLHLLLISRKINIFLNIQSQENVTHVTQHNILLRVQFQLNSNNCTIQWNEIKTIRFFPQRRAGQSILCLNIIQIQHLVTLIYTFLVIEFVRTLNSLQISHAMFYTR